MTAYNEDAWQEFFLFSVREKGGNEVQFAGITEDITAMDWGEKDIEGITLAQGGRVAKRTPMTDESLTLKAYPVSADMDGTGAIQWFHPQGTAIADQDVTEPLAISNTNLRRKHQLVLLWSENLPSYPTTASQPPAAGENAYRIQVENAYMTSFKPSFDDKIMSAEMTFKWTPFDKAGSANKREESTVGTTVLVAVRTYT